MYKNVLTVQNRQEFRTWLAERSASEPECWVDVKRGRPADPEPFKPRISKSRKLQDTV